MPTAAEFLESVDIVDCTSLSQAEKTCYICQEDFSEALLCVDKPRADLEALSILDMLPFRRLKDIGCDEPIRLPCNHVFGSWCLQRWLADKGNSCPLCRLRLCVRENEWDLEEEFERRYIALAHVPFRALLSQRTCNEGSILLTSRIVRTIKAQLVIRMIQFLLRLQQLPPILELVDTYDDEVYDDETAYLACITRYWMLIPQDTAQQLEYVVARAMLMGPALKMAHLLLCKSLNVVARKGCILITQWRLTQVLLTQFSRMPMPKRYKVMIGVSVQATVDFERRRWAFETDYRREVKRQNAELFEEVAGGED